MSNSKEIKMRRFYLVQRMKLSPLADVPVEERKGLQKLGSNPFGYGNLGHYDLEYMGSAEFEWGAIPEALDRLQKAGKKLATGQHEYRGHLLDFVWIEKEGEPFEAWEAWAEGRPIDPYSGRVSEQRPFYGKERPYELEQRLNGDQPYDPKRGWTTDIWWSLSDNVMWSFADEGHIANLFATAGKVPATVRG